MAQFITAADRLAADRGGLEGVGPGLASAEGWLIALVAVASLLAVGYWSTSRRRRTPGRPVRHQRHR